MDVRSDLIVEYLDTQNMKEAVSSYANSHTQAVRQETVKTELLPDGIRVTYDFRELGFVIPVEHRLRADYLETRIRMDEIQETGSFVLLSIRLLPNFGAGGTETGRLDADSGRFGRHRPV